MTGADFVEGVAALTEHRQPNTNPVAPPPRNGADRVTPH